MDYCIAQRVAFNTGRHYLHRKQRTREDCSALFSAAVAAMSEISFVLQPKIRRSTWVSKPIAPKRDNITITRLLERETNTSPTCPSSDKHTSTQQHSSNTRLEQRSYACFCCCCTAAFCWSRRARAALCAAAVAARSEKNKMLQLKIRRSGEVLKPLDGFTKVGAHPLSCLLGHATLAT